MSAARASALQVQPGSMEQLRQFADGGYLYALLDGSEHPDKMPELDRMGPTRCVHLFCQASEQIEAQFSPVLVQVDSTLLEWIVNSLWKEPWGVFALSKAGLETLRAHFRKFLLVELPGGERWYFRFYDPRILRIYLPNCFSWELQKFFGPVRGFAIPYPSGQDVWIVKGPSQVATDRQITDPNVTLMWQIRPEQVRAFTRAMEGGKGTTGQMPLF